MTTEAAMLNATAGTTNPWWEGPLVGFDTETTGPNPHTDLLVTACIVVETPDGVTASHNWLVDPGIEIPEGAAAVHGITTERARAEGVPVAEALPQILATLSALSTWQGAPVVAFNGAFDFTLLDREARRHGHDPFIPRRVIDPYVLDKQVDKYRKGKRQLGPVSAHYGVALDNAHSADADALAAVQVARQIARRRPLPTDLDALHAAQITWRAEQQNSLAAWFRSQGKPADIDPTWPVHPYTEEQN